MTSYKSILALGVMALFGTRQVAASDWFEVARSQDANTSAFLSDKRIEVLPDGRVEAWAKYESKKPVKLQSGSSYTTSMLLLRVECERRTLQHLSLTRRDRSGNVVFSSSDVGDAERVVPESVGEAVLEEMCAIKTKLRSAVSRRTSRAAAEAQVTESHLAAIEAAHPGWRSMVDSEAFTSWVLSKPEAERAEIARIEKEGTTAEVVHLFDLYKAHRKSQP